jgi:hypothetical protein
VGIHVGCRWESGCTQRKAGYARDLRLPANLARFS